MPLLRDLNCSIELSDNQEPLQELGTVYGDGLVETFVPVPKKQQTFTVHLSSKNFIAPGIAMYVFIDGIYQCNRNRQNLKLRRPPDRRSLVDFKVRQKEERQKDGLVAIAIRKLCVTVTVTKWSSPRLREFYSHFLIASLDIQFK